MVSAACSSTPSITIRARGTLRKIFTSPLFMVAIIPPTRAVFFGTLARIMIVVQRVWLCTACWRDQTRTPKHAAIACGTKRAARSTPVCQAAHTRSCTVVSPRTCLAPAVYSTLARIPFITRIKPHLALTICFVASRPMPSVPLIATAFASATCLVQLSSVATLQRTRASISSFVILCPSVSWSFAAMVLDSFVQN